MAPPDPRILSYLEANKTWAASPGHKSPIPFLEMQKGGRARVDGTVMLCTFSRQGFRSQCWVL